MSMSTVTMIPAAAAILMHMSTTMTVPAAVNTPLHTVMTNGSSCGCGHTHEHEHHHGDSCSCGYTHENEHHHNASCGCGQEALQENSTGDVSSHSDRRISASAVRKVYTIENLDCANCAAAVERKIATMPEVQEVSLTFATRQLRITAENPDALLDRSARQLPL